MFQDVSVGNGAVPAVTQQVTIHYVVSRPNGEVVANSRANGQTLSFRLNSTSVVAGLREAVLTMRVGGIRRAFVPPSLLAGTVPSGLPAGENLVFEIELISATS